MSANLVLGEKTAVVLLNEINQDPVLKAQLELYFTPYCDCDIADWIVKRVELGDQFVIDTIVELIQYRDPYPITRGGPQPVLGQLLTQYCNGNDFVGIYADGNGGQVQKTIEVNSISQRCVAPEKIAFYFPLQSQQAALDAGLDNVIFDTEPYFKSGQPIILGQYMGVPTSNIPNPGPNRTPRLQFKIGNLPSGDYHSLTLKVYSPYREDGGYIYDPSLELPGVNLDYNAIYDDWFEGLPARDYNFIKSTVNVSYNPNTQIVKIDTAYLNCGTCHICFEKDQKVIGWIRLTASQSDVDPGPGKSYIYGMLLEYGSLDYL